MSLKTLFGEFRVTLFFLSFIFSWYSLRFIILYIYRSVFEDLPLATPSIEQRLTFPIDIVEREDKYELYCELPGIAKDKIDIKVGKAASTTL